MLWNRERETLPRDRLAILQLQRLRQTVGRQLESVPPMRERLREAGVTSPEDVTVDRSSFRVSTLTTVTSGVSVRVANTLPMIIINNKTTAEAPIMIFVLRLNAIFILSSQQ